MPGIHHNQHDSRRGVFGAYHPYARPPLQGLRSQCAYTSSRLAFAENSPNMTAAGSIQNRPQFHSSGQHRLLESSNSTSTLPTSSAQQPSQHAKRGPPTPAPAPADTRKTHLQSQIHPQAQQGSAHTSGSSRETTPSDGQASDRDGNPTHEESHSPGSCYTAQWAGGPVDLERVQRDLVEFKAFLLTAPALFVHCDIIRRFRLPTGEQISCVRWSDIFYVTGTDIVRCLTYRFQAFGRQIINKKKFEEGIFSDLRNLKCNTDATLETPKSPFLHFLYKHQCVRTKKKQKVFYWYSVRHERLFIDALERDLKKEASASSHPPEQPTTRAVAEPALSFSYDPRMALQDQIGNAVKMLPTPLAAVVDASMGKHQLDQSGVINCESPDQKLFPSKTLMVDCSIGMGGLGLSNLGKSGPDGSGRQHSGDGNGESGPTGSGGVHNASGGKSGNAQDSNGNNNSNSNSNGQGGNGSHGNGQGQGVYDTRQQAMHYQGAPVPYSVGLSRAQQMVQAQVQAQVHAQLAEARAEGAENADSMFEIAAGLGNGLSNGHASLRSQANPLPRYPGGSGLLSSAQQRRTEQHYSQPHQPYASEQPRLMLGPSAGSRYGNPGAGPGGSQPWIGMYSPAAQMYDARFGPSGGYPLGSQATNGYPASTGVRALLLGGTPTRALFEDPAPGNSYQIGPAGYGSSGYGGQPLGSNGGNNGGTGYSNAYSAAYSGGYSGAYGAYGGYHPGYSRGPEQLPGQQPPPQLSAPPAGHYTPTQAVQPPYGSGSGSGSGSSSGQADRTGASGLNGQNGATSASSSNNAASLGSGPGSHGAVVGRGSERRPLQSVKLELDELDISSDFPLDFLRREDIRLGNTPTFTHFPIEDPTEVAAAAAAAAAAAGW